MIGNHPDYIRDAYPTAQDHTRDAYPTGQDHTRDVNPTAQETQSCQPNHIHRLV